MNSQEFGAEPRSVLEVFTSHNGGFRIPMYQRPYTWDQKNIERLFESIIPEPDSVLSDTQSTSLTFLGTLIVVEEDKGEKEKTYQLPSLSVIDGQQRLTALSMIIGKLRQKMVPLLKRLKETLKDNNECHLGFSEEIDSLLGDLFESNLGRVKRSGGKDEEYFPRLVLEDSDKRSGSYTSSNEGTYESSIAKYLYSLKNEEESAEKNKNQQFKWSGKHKETAEEIDSFLEKIENGEGKTITEELLNHIRFPGLKNEKRFKTSANKVLKNSVVAERTSKLIRLLSFGRCLLNNTKLILVEISKGSEDYAYDIFESLNTTGQPLTAIQTLKPVVAKYLRVHRKKYSDSSEKKYFDTVEKLLDDGPLKKPEELVVSLGHYLHGDGKDATKNLGKQRQYLQRHYEDLNRTDDSRKAYIKAIADIGQYEADFFYLTSEIPNNIKVNLANEERDLLAFCLSFISATNTRMSVPILARYYFALENDQPQPERYFEATKAFAAFLALRRAATQNTQGIEEVFRNVLRTKEPLNTLGLSFFKNREGEQNNIVDIKKLKEFFRNQLKKIVPGKEEWVNIVKTMDMCQGKKAFAKFLLLVSSHNTKCDEEEPPLLVKIIDNRQSRTMIAENWEETEYKTVEHFAPQSPKEGWDENIYGDRENPSLVHSIGNLTLLPKKDNEQVGNMPWEQKKLYYEALIAESQDERARIFENARQQGHEFASDLKSYLEKRTGPRLVIIQSIAKTNKWSRQVIEKRSENIAGIVWDRIYPWLK